MNSTSKSVFQRSYLNENTAGAGALGFVLAIILFLISYLLMRMESHFLMMFTASAGLLAYHYGPNLWILFSDTIRTIFTRKHIDNRAQEILLFHRKLRSYVQEHKYDKQGLKVVAEKINSENPSSTALEFEVSKFFSEKSSNSDKATYSLTNYLRTHYYADAHEHYSTHANALEFAANLLPLIGIVGTLCGMLDVFSQMNQNSTLEISQIASGMGLAMKSTLYGALFSVFFKVLSSRFHQQMEVLDYDFDELIAGIYVLSGEKE